MKEDHGKISMTELAVVVAVEAHLGKNDKGGYPYLLHPLFVLAHMDTEDEIQTAALHDVVEDTDYTLDDLREYGFSETVIQAVDAITKREGEPYKKYIKRVEENPIAKKVKIWDIKHNLDITRLPKKIKDKDVERFYRYRWALARLTKNPKPTADGY